MRHVVKGEGKTPFGVLMGERSGRRPVGKPSRWVAGMSEM